jgi:hypothetical protein
MSAHLPRSQLKGLVWALVVLNLSIGPMFANPLPKPKVDYFATGVFPGRGIFAVYHHGGKLRMDIGLDNVRVPVSALLDLSSRNVLLQLPLPQPNIAVEMDFGADADYGQISGDGKRISTRAEKVAGQRCNIWRFENVRAVGEVCITPDGITLRTELIEDGIRRLVMEITKVRRAPQELAQFRLRPATQIIKALPGSGGTPSESDEGSELNQQDRILPSNAH